MEAPTPQPFVKFESKVLEVAISPQGRTRIAVGLADGTVEIWDVLTKTKWVSCQGHKGSVNSVAFSPDGSMVVSGSEDITVRLWDAKTGESIGKPFTGHTGSVNSVAFSPDGNTVASGSIDKTVRLWDVNTGKAINQIYSHAQPVTSVAFSPDGNTIVSGSWDNTVWLWDLNTEEASARSAAPQASAKPFVGHTKPVLSVAFSPDSKTIVSGSWDTTVRLWDIETGEAIGQPFFGHKYLVNSVAFSPDGSSIISGSADKTVRLWDLSDPQHKRQIIIGEHQGEVHSVAFDPQGDYIISAGEDGIKTWRWTRVNIRRVPQPFRNDQPIGEDSLDIAKELQSLADVLMLRSLEPPLAVAILGSWGSGKSFGMHLIEKQITKIRCQKLTAKQTWGEKGDEPNLSPYVGHVYQIKFNAWSYAKSDLWASLMQTIFDQLDRQLTLEKQLRDVLGKDSDLAGSDIWRVLNQMNDSDKKAILESELSQEVFAQFKNQIADGNALWDILIKVRQDEKEKLERTEKELESLQEEVRKEYQDIENKYHQNLEKLEQEFISQEVNRIQSQVEDEMTDVSTLVVFLSQLKETLKDDFGDSILKDFLQSCDFQNRQDLEKQFPMLKLDKLAESNLIDVAEDLVKNKNEKVKTIIDNIHKITYFLQEQPSQIVSFIEFTKRDKKIILLFICATALPFIAYFIIVDIIPHVLPILKNISTALQLWLTSLSAIPAISIGVEILKKVQVLQVKTARFLKAARENVEAEKQKLVQTKEEKIKEQIEQRKEEYKQNQFKAINDEREKAENKEQIADKQKKIEQLQAQVEKQKQRVGLTAQYKSLLDFVNNRLEDNSYQKLLGIMHQIQDDLADLSDHLTYKAGKTNPEKLKVLKDYFPRGPARIVLYIDDLDRCPPDKVVQVLEAVQLLLNTELFIIILGIDDRYIGRALEHIYRGVLKRGGTPSGVDYLEKIIQLPYRMRPISKDVTVGYLKSLVDVDAEENLPQENYNSSVVEEMEKLPEEELTVVSEDNDNNDHNVQETFVDEPEINEEVSLPQYAAIPSSDFPSMQSIQSMPSSFEQRMMMDDLEDNSDDNKENIKYQYSVNTDPLVTFESFSVEEFTWISECCQHVDLTPRTAKRLINICKIIKTIWTPLPHDITWKVEPLTECKQSLIAFLALAGRYPKEMRKFLEEIYLEFEEKDVDTVKINKIEWLNRLQNLDLFMDRHNQREWKKFKNDFMKMSPRDEFMFEKRTFNLARSFCFVGDIGYDPDDSSNVYYRVEDGKKIIGFNRND